MTHHPPPLGAPGAPPDPRPRPGRPTLVARLGLVLAAGLLAASCSTEETTGTLDGALDGADRASGDLGESGASELSFGDPGQVGFEPVEVTEVDPVEPTGGDDVRLEVDEPELVIERVADELGPIGGADELLDTIGPVDGADEDASEPDGRPRNELGELLILDDEASLACAQIDIAIGLLDDGLPGIAIERIVGGADRADASELEDIRAWAEPLRAVVEGGAVTDPAPLVGFLTVCTEGGYEL